MIINLCKHNHNLTEDQQTRCYKQIREVDLPGQIYGKKEALILTGIDVRIVDVDEAVAIGSGLLVMEADGVHELVDDGAQICGAPHP